MKPETEALMHRYLDARATAGEAAALSTLLATDPETADRFAELTRLDENLRVELKLETRAALFTKRLARQTPPMAPRSAHARRHQLAAAAVLTLLGAGAWWLSGAPGPQALGKKWATARLDRQLSNPSEFPVPSGMDRPADPAAELRRELRGFALPDLHLRDMPLSDALATLNRQWTDLPHAGGTQGKDLPIALSTQARAAWSYLDQEPRVTVDIPQISLHTALQLVAAQAGLKVEIASNAVTLEADPRMNEPGEKTWSIPVAQAQMDPFLVKNNKLNFLQTLERSQFFLTHKSHSPELTNQGSPRVSMFPLIKGGAAGSGGKLGAEGAIPPVAPDEVKPQPRSEIVPGPNFNMELGPEVESVVVLPAGENTAPSPNTTIAGVPGVVGGYQEVTASNTSRSLSTDSLFSSADEVYFKAKDARETANLLRWLGTFGLPRESLNYTPSQGMLKVTGGPRALRTASAAVAALTESVQAGVSVDLRFVQTMDGLSTIFPGRGQGATAVVSASEVERFCKTASQSHPDIPVLRLPPALSLRDRKISYVVREGKTGIISMKKPTEEGSVSTHSENTAKGLEHLQLEAEVRASKLGGRWNLTVELKEGSGTNSAPFSVPEGQWLALRVESQKGILFVRSRETAITP